ncbi:MAG: metallophosphoesterase [Cyanobacteria bacterium J06631_6]
MKRRRFLSGIGGGFSLALGSRHLLAGTATAENIAKPAADQSSALFRFAALGDVGTGNIGQMAIAEAMNGYFQQHPFELVLMTGDNIYEDGNIRRVGATFSKPYHFLRKQGVPFYAVLGNHDVLFRNGVEQVKFSGFNMGGRYYTLTQGAVQFFALDSNDPNWKVQLAWLEQNLAESTAAWKIVFAHHPLYSSGLHGSSEKLITMLSPLFKRYGVQLYINGHDHNYERTESINGTTYLTVGAGAKTRPVFSSDWTARSAAKLSFAAIAIYPQRLSIQGIEKNGKVFDRGEIAVS